MAIITINDDNYLEHINPVVDGETKMRGLRVRNYGTHPVGYLPEAKPFDLPLLPESEWQDRLDEQLRTGAHLDALAREVGMFGQRMPSRDQNGKGYCWAHSSVSAMLLLRAFNNQPYADLSAYAIACIIKNYRDEGGWGAESLEFAAKTGCPTSKYWPQQSMSRSNDTPEMRANAQLHLVSEWMDFDPQAMKAQLITCLLLNIPVVTDFNWWGHSVCTYRLLSLNPFQTKIWNSWGDSWSENGAGMLEGRKAMPDGAIAPRVIRASAA